MSGGWVDDRLAGEEQGYALEDAPRLAKCLHVVYPRHERLYGSRFGVRGVVFRV